MEKKKWTDIPQDVHEAIRHVRRFLRLMAWDLSDREFMSDDLRCWILATHADNEADNLDALLAEYELPSDFLPPLDYEESEPERTDSRQRIKLHAVIREKQ